MLFRSPITHSLFLNTNLLLYTDYVHNLYFSFPSHNVFRCWWLCYGVLGTPSFQRAIFFRVYFAFSFCFCFFLLFLLGIYFLVQKKKCIMEKKEILKLWCLEVYTGFSTISSSFSTYLFPLSLSLSLPLFIQVKYKNNLKNRKSSKRNERKRS